MKSKSLNISRKAISTTLAAVIIVIVIVAAGIGGYYALTYKAPESGCATSTSNVSGTNIQNWTPPSCLPSATISETGSSLLYPLFNVWVTSFTTAYSGVHINTASTGSGTGQASAEKGLVQIGASDAYLKDSQEAQYPYILNIPLAISAQQINYNLPGLSQSIHLNFSGPVLAGIYNGSITTWGDSKIVNLQTNQTAKTYLGSIGSQTIIPVRRFDGSGDTFIFTQFLSYTTASWNSSVGYGTTVSWPNVPGELSGTGNGGVIADVNQYHYSLGYVGVSYLTQTTQEGLGYAFLKNQAGNFVDISQANIAAASSQLASQTPTDGRISLIFAPGANSYPIINYEYALVAKNQTSMLDAQVVSTFLMWALSPTYGNSGAFLNQVGFVALPSSVAQISVNEIAQITG
jgi:phosphate transport system substrate-binding protein